MMPFIAWGSCIILFAVMFLCFGNTQEAGRLGSSIVSWLIKQWLDGGSESGHGFLIPFVSAYFVWHNRKDLKKSIADGAVDLRALIVITAALFIYWAGVRAQQPRLGVISLIMLLWSVPWLLYGFDLAKRVTVACAYLLFAMPMSFLVSATLPLRLIATQISVFILQGLGVGAVSKGTAIISSPPGRFALDVADACSGLRSIIALCALVAAYAYLAHTSNWRRWILFLFAIPIAIAGNVVRVTSLVIIASMFGSDKALHIAHDYSGYIVFIVAVLLMVAISRQLERIGRSHGSSS